MTQLTNAKAFFDVLREEKLLGPSLDQSEVDGVNAILRACGEANWGPRYTAYALATADRETGGTMKPIKEWGGVQYFTRNYDITGRNPQRAREMGNTTPGDGPRYCGRGYVQLTWKSNYRKAGDALGYDLVSQPELALRPDIAAAIMVRGMSEGWFTGKKLNDYINAKGCDYFNARRIINGTDHAREIAEEASRYLVALHDGGWK